VCVHVTMNTVVYGYPDKPELTTTPRTPQTGFVMVGVEMYLCYSLDTIRQTQVLKQTENSAPCSTPSPHTHTHTHTCACAHTHRHTHTHTASSTIHATGKLQRQLGQALPCAMTAAVANITTTKPATHHSTILASSLQLTCDGPSTATTVPT